VKKRVLVVEDDEGLADIMCHNLEHDGFEVRRVADGASALKTAKAFAPDLVLLDLMLPHVSGLDLCAAWRDQGNCQIIMVTARNRKDDKLLGLKTGADDYITKPFDLDELMARVHAVLRRGRPVIHHLTLGSVTIDFSNLTAYRGEEEIELTRRDFEILRYLAQRPNVVVYRDELLRDVWGFHDEPFTRSVDTAIARLRKKLEIDPHHPVYIHTAHGDGYYLTLGEDPGAVSSR
jgi:DNA-binding response OmpR family regulator